MKINLLILILLLFASSVLGQSFNTDDSVKLIQFYTMTRGGKVTVEVKKDKVIYKETGFNEIEKEIEIDQEDWLGFCKIVQDINLAQLHTLMSPTDVRAYDGAWYAWLTIETESQTYKSRDFDRGRPMKEIEPLVDLIKSYIPEK